MQRRGRWSGVKAGWRAPRTGAGLVPEQARLDQALREGRVLKGDFSSLPQRPPAREGFAPGDTWQCLEACLVVTIDKDGGDGGATGWMTGMLLNSP